MNNRITTIFKTTSRPASRILRALGVGIGFISLVAIGIFISSRDSQASSTGGAFQVDVAIDATTFRFSRESAVVPTNIVRGDTFIVDGLIYPGGSIQSGNTPFPATTAEPIGYWVCRGTFQTDTAGLVSGVTPHVYSTQYFLFNDGSSVVTDGPEGGAVFTRAIIGGVKGGATSGHSLETPIGANATGLFNLRFEFSPGRN